MASSSCGLGSTPYPMGPLVRKYIEQKASEIHLRGDGVTDIDVWEAWKKTKVPQAIVKNWLENRVFPQDRSSSPITAATPAHLRNRSQPLSATDENADLPRQANIPALARFLGEEVNEDLSLHAQKSRYAAEQDTTENDDGTEPLSFGLGVQTSRVGGPFTDEVLEIAMAMSALGVAGQADLMRHLYKGTAKHFVRNKGDKQLVRFRPDVSIGFAAQLRVWKEQRDAMGAISAKRADERRRKKDEARKRKDNPGMVAGDGGDLDDVGMGKRERRNLKATLGPYWRIRR